MSELGTARHIFVFAAARAYFCLAAKVAKRQSARSLGDLLVFDDEIKRTRLRLRQLLILRHLQTAGARLRNQARRLTRKLVSKLDTSSSLFLSGHEKRNLYPLIRNVSQIGFFFLAFPSGTKNLSQLPLITKLLRRIFGAARKPKIK